MKDKKEFNLFVLGGALFSMFFGAGNLIFPGFIGLESGSDWIISMFGFLITGIGLPLMGIIALAKVGGDLDVMGSRVSKGFSKFLGITVSIAIGPLLAIPRTGATSYEMAGSVIIPGLSPELFAIFYFGIVLLLVLNPNGIIDSLGKYLTPGLILILFLIIFKGIVSPLGTSIETNLPSNFSFGFKIGYQTMDTLASIFFGGIIVNSLISSGVTEKKDQMKYTLMAGSIALIGLGLVYGGLTYIGSSLSGIYPGMEKTELTLKIADLTLKSFGKYGLGIAVLLACLTTSIGLVSSVSSYFNRLSNGRLQYRPLAIGITVFSGIMSIGGVEKLIHIAEPILLFMYPITITVVILTVLLGDDPNKNIYRFSVGLVGIVSILDVHNLYKLGFAKIIEGFPLYNLGIPWVIPALVGSGIGFLVKENPHKTVK